MGFVKKTENRELITDNRQQTTDNWQPTTSISLYWVPTAKKVVQVFKKIVYVAWYSVQVAKKIVDVAWYLAMVLNKVVNVLKKLVGVD